MAAGLARHVRKSVCFDVDKKNVGAFPGERKRDGAADAGRRAGDQRFLAANDAHLVKVRSAVTRVRGQQITPRLPIVELINRTTCVSVDQEPPMRRISLYQRRDCL